MDGVFARCRTDGIADNLLPNTQLKFAYRDSKRDDSSAFFGALELTQSAFDQKGVHAIVGAASSGPSMSAALVTARAMVPQISYSSTSALLSDGASYPYFLRTCPSDAFQGDGLADLVQNLFGYTRVASVASTDGYGAAGIAAFLSAAASRGLNVLVSLNFNNNANDFTEQYRELQRSDARIIILFCQTADAGVFMKGALAEGIGGPGYMWLGSDALSQSSLWTTNSVLSDPVERLRVLKGFFGLRPSVGQGTAVYNAFLARQRALPSSLPVNSTVCNMATDDDLASPRYIWAQDSDNNASTPLACGGTDNQAEGSYAPYAYDAVYAIANALHHLIEVQGKTSIVGSELLDALVRNVAFDGVTGRIEFHDGSTHPDKQYHGDRRVGIAYDVVNYASNEAGLVRVGKWTPIADSAWIQRWQQLGNLTYSTDDNSKPPDFVEPLGDCASGYVLELFEGSLTCTPCQPGTFEVSHRLCQIADRFSFVPEPAMNHSMRCNASMEVLDPLFTDGSLYLKRLEGAVSSAQCLCIEGFYFADGACQTCPEGAVCPGAMLMPIADIGFGQLVWTNGTRQLTNFYPCTGLERCPGSDCDCIGGAVISAMDVTPQRCADGYVQGSPLCAKCDDGYANSLGVCTECTMPSTTYLLISLVVTLLWFPVFAKVAEMTASIEISVGVLQFLGLYSKYAIEWPSTMQALFNYLSFFNLDLDMMLIRCWGQLNYFTSWWIQAFLPLVYVIYVVLKLMISFALLKITEWGWTGPLLRRGWRPRRNYSLSSLRETYMPAALMYLNAYFITGIQKALEPLICTGTPGEEYLKSDPLMRCWQGDHYKLLAWDVLAIMIYFVLLPGMVYFALFVLVPLYGLDNEMLNHNLGFLWARFETRCYWWEAIDMIRKIGLSVIMLVIDDPYTQSLAGVFAVGVVMLANFSYAPFIRQNYDRLDALGCVVLALVFILGLSVHYRKSIAETAQIQEEVGGGESIFLLVFLCAFSCSACYVLSLDVKLLKSAAKAEKLRNSKQIRLSRKIFRVGIAEPSGEVPNNQFLNWLEKGADESHITILRELEREILRTQADAEDMLSNNQRGHYRTQTEAEPNLVGWLVAPQNDPKLMSTYIDALSTETEVPLVAPFLASARLEEIAFWLAACASPGSRQKMAVLASAVETFAKEHQTQESLISRLLGTLTRCCCQVQKIVAASPARGMSAALASAQYGAAAAVSTAESVSSAALASAQYGAAAAISTAESVSSLAPPQVRRSAEAAVTVASNTGARSLMNAIANFGTDRNPVESAPSRKMTFTSLLKGKSGRLEIEKSTSILALLQQLRDHTVSETVVLVPVADSSGWCPDVRQSIDLH